jgi:hypothetical protein
MGFMLTRYTPIIMKTADNIFVGVKVSFPKNTANNVAKKGCV